VNPKMYVLLKKARQYGLLDRTMANSPESWNPRCSSAPLRKGAQCTDNLRATVIRLQPSCFPISTALSP
jgi:hypothetical protein